MTPNRFNSTKTQEERKQEEIRAFKIKAEYLKLTLRGLQNMLDAEKEKLMREKGEVEGLAKEKGLILLEPDQEDFAFNREPITFSNKFENYVSHSPTHRENIVPITSPVRRSDYHTNNNHLIEGRSEQIDWGQGDACRASFTGSRDGCLFSSGIDWEPQHYGDYSSAMWDIPLQGNSLEISYSEQRDIFPEQIFNSGYLDQTLYRTLPDDNLPFYDYNPEINATDFTPNYLLEDPDSSQSSQQHLVALMKEVDHISQAIENLENE